MQRYGFGGELAATPIFDTNLFETSQTSYDPKLHTFYNYRAQTIMNEPSVLLQSEDDLRIQTSKFVVDDSKLTRYLATDVSNDRILRRDDSIKMHFRISNQQRSETKKKLKNLVSQQQLLNSSIPIRTLSKPALQTLNQVNNPFINQNDKINILTALPLLPTYNKRLPKLNKSQTKQNRNLNLKIQRQLSTVQVYTKKQTNYLKPSIQSTILLQPLQHLNLVQSRYMLPRKQYQPDQTIQQPIQRQGVSSLDTLDKGKQIQQRVIESIRKNSQPLNQTNQMNQIYKIPSQTRNFKTIMTEQQLKKDPQKQMTLPKQIQPSELSRSMIMITVCNESPTKKDSQRKGSLSQNLSNFKPRQISAKTVQSAEQSSSEKVEQRERKPLHSNYGYSTQSYKLENRHASGSCSGCSYGYDPRLKSLDNYQKFINQKYPKFINQKYKSNLNRHVQIPKDLKLYEKQNVANRDQKIAQLSRPMSLKSTQPSFPITTMDDQRIYLKKFDWEKSELYNMYVSAQESKVSLLQRLYELNTEIFTMQELEYHQKILYLLSDDKKVRRKAVNEHFDKTFKTLKILMCLLEVEFHYQRMQKLYSEKRTVECVLLLMSRCQWMYSTILHLNTIFRLIQKKQNEVKEVSSFAPTKLNERLLVAIKAFLIENSLYPLNFNFAGQEMLTTLRKVVHNKY